VADKAPARLEQSQLRAGVLPDALYVLVDGLSAQQSWRLSWAARTLAYARAPKLTGDSARGLDLYWGEGFFGVRWMRPSLWYVERGTGPHTMRHLAGKTIPMWVSDEGGAVSRENPKAKKRITPDGRRQVLIFRRVAKLGQRKNVVRRVSGRPTRVSVPASYPGAPGRIALRHDALGHVLSGNAGVRWRHPGIIGRHFIARSIADVAEGAGLGRPKVLPTLRRT
jgi:hypothetical protein